MGSEDGLNQLEVRAVVHEEVREIHAEVRDALRDQKVVLDRLADGAQAAIYSATILHGNKELGLKGAIPDLQERMEHVEDELVDQKATNDQRHKENTERLDRLEASQNRVWRVVVHIWCWLTRKGVDGNTGVGRLALLIGSLLMALQWVFRHFKEWIR